MNINSITSAMSDAISIVEVAQGLREQLDPDQYYELMLPLWGQRVKELPVSVEGFGLYYRAKFRRPLPPTARFIWAEQFVDAFNNKTGVLLEGHRGSAKSTFLLTWMEYITGKRPHGSSQLIRINEQQAKEFDTLIAETIESGVGWKACFPNVVPDFGKGWSMSGRYIMDLEVVGEDKKGYGKWIQMTSSDHLSEPSFLCAGITSRDFIGKHPSNGQYFDDLHDEGNTRSAREMQEIVDIIEKNIAPTWTRPEGHPTLGVACTLWNENDGYHALLRTGLFKHVKTPIFVYADNPYIQVGDEMVYVKWVEEHPVELDIHGREIKAMWYPAYGGEVIRSLQKQQPVYFGLMYLCDMASAKGNVLKAEWLHTFPRERVLPSYPVYFGIDFASTEDKLKEGAGRDFFALAVIAGLPWGGGVIIDGFVEQLGFFEAVQRVTTFSDKYPTLVTVGVEKFGAGEKFSTNLIYNTKLPVVSFPPKGAPVRSKGQRYQKELAPMFTDGRLWLSDISNKFIDTFTQEWISWDGGKTSTGHDDCLDAVYVACGMAIGHLLPVPKQEELPVVFAGGLGRLKSAWSSVGRKKE